MNKILIFLSIPFLLVAEYTSSISVISPKIKKRMITGGSWKKNCPVPLQNLRYLKMKYWNFDGKSKIGEMIVNKTLAKEITVIFGELYRDGYPIHRMQLVSDYGANDFQSIEADNTSAFNCRLMTTGKKWSSHSYGKAIDINPIENPYIYRSGKILHKSSLKYRKRIRTKITSEQKAMFIQNDFAVELFKEHGWRWGGDWRTLKDYQHFEKPVNNRKRDKSGNNKIELEGE